MEVPQPDYGRPGQILESLFHSLSPDLFQEAVLDRYLIPALNSLPPNHRNDFSRLFHQALIDTRIIRKVHDHESKEVLNTLMNDLEQDCLTNPGLNGTHAQGEFMREIAQVITEWLTDLWQVGAEAGTEVQRVHQALMYCIRICNRASVVRSRARWADYCKRAVSIEASNRTVVYQEQRVSIKRVILWVWRELLLFTAAAGHHNQLTPIIDDLRRSGWLADVRQTVPSGNETHDARGQDLHRLHWNPRVTAAVPGLRQRLQ